MPSSPDVVTRRSTTLFTKSNPAIGARPGSLAIPEGSPFPRIFVTRYDRDGVEKTEVSDVEELRGVLGGDRVVWVDVRGLGDEHTIRAVGEIFGLHRIALENAVNIPQRAKSELYDRYQLVIARAPELNEDGDLETPQVCFILGDRWLLTFQERYFAFFDSVRDRLDDGLGPMRDEGADYLCYALLDAMVDRYYPVAQRLSEVLEDMEDLVVESPHPLILTRIHAVRRQIVVLRRVGWPQREAINALIREQSPYLKERARTYLRDTYDHIAQNVEFIDSAREWASDLAEAYISNVSHRTNEIMKVLTLMASIFIPLTFVAGIYGMNFEYMPELAVRYGYFTVIFVMIVLGFGMYAFFKRRGWIGTPPPPEIGVGRPSDSNS